MAAAPQISTKRVAISKATTQMVGVIAAACFVTIFCLFAFKAAFSLNRYQAKVTTAKEKAHQQLQTNITAYDSLQKSYQTFDDALQNVIGGSRNGLGDKDGQNSKIVLDALPSSYDFPALASSLEKILNNQSLKVTSITGTDDQVNQEGNASSPAPQAVSMPFTFSISDANYDSIKQLTSTLQASIRPIQIDTMTIAGGGNAMTLDVSAHTYYQPAKNVNIKQEVIK